MSEENIRLELKRLSKDFKFKFNNDWFDLVWIEKEEEIFLEFLSDCKDTIYEKYGSKLKERISNLEKFVDSKDFKKCIKRYGGSLSSKKEILNFRKLVETLDDSKIKIKLLNFVERILLESKNKDFFALLTKTKIKKEQQYLMRSILRHEWIHQLLFNNQIKFSRIKKKYWIYDEGLCTYFEYFLDNNLDILEEKRDKEKYIHEKEYYVNAIKFREMLKGKTPKKQKEIIRAFYNSLK